MRVRRLLVRVVVALIAAAGLVSLWLNPSVRGLLASRMQRPRTVAQALSQHGPAARERLAPVFRQASVAYPPERVTFACVKSQRILEVWATQDGKTRLIKRYQVLAASGHQGPKLREGDHQVPEGVYRIAGLNPNSSYHLSMKLDYPNAFDRAQAKRDGRTNLGGDIFIHGSNGSVGCLAMGDRGIEDLFVLVADVGASNVSVLIAPVDPRTSPMPAVIEGAPSWLPELYTQIKKAFEALPAGRARS